MPVRTTRRRYLLIRIENEEELDFHSLNEIIEAKIHYLYGITGAIEMNYRPIEFFPNANKAIIRCNHKMLNEMRTVLSHISKMKGKRTKIEVLRVSGTIKSLKKHEQDK